MIALQKRWHTLRGDLALRRLVTNTGWVFGANSIGTVASFFQSILVARTLGVELFGVLAVVMAFVTVVNRLTSFRMNEFVVKFVSDAQSQGRTNRAAAVVKVAMITEAGASIVAFGIVVWLAPLGANLFVHTPTAAALIAIYAVVVLGNLISESVTGVLQVFNQFRLLSILASIGKIIALGAVAVAVVMHSGLWGILLAYLVGNLVLACLLLFAAIRECGRQLGRGWWRASLSAMRGYWRSAARFVINTNLSATLSLITKDSDLLWLGLLTNPIDVGYYKLATSLSALVFMPVSPMAQTIYPEISRSAAAGNWPGFRRLLQRSSGLVGVYVIPASLFLSLAGAWLIGTFYGPEYVPATVAMVILLLGLCYSNIFAWSRSALLALNRPDYPTKVNVLIAVLKLLGIWILLPTWGYVGNAVLLTTLYIVGVSLSIRKVHEELQHREWVTP